MWSLVRKERTTVGSRPRILWFALPGKAIFAVRLHNTALCCAMRGRNHHPIKRSFRVWYHPFTPAFPTQQQHSDGDDIVPRPNISPTSSSIRYSCFSPHCRLIRYFWQGCFTKTHSSFHPYPWIWFRCMCTYEWRSKFWQFPFDFRFAGFWIVRRWRKNLSTNLFLPNTVISRTRRCIVKCAGNTLIPTQQNIYSFASCVLYRNW